ncbi:MAG TPA: ABC transporter ATP-binding protein, partial [Treponemataceae bacterium]|nr:ABC transporter ATP-binding protein [Treponemataceae bacterium]
MVRIDKVVKIYHPTGQAQRKNKQQHKVEGLAEENLASVHALAGVSTKIHDGEFTAIAGPSGSGKTTLLNLIGCLDSITSGTVFIDNDNISIMNDSKKNKIRKEKIGFVFQSYNLIPVLTAQENVELALQLLTKYNKAQIRKMASDILIEVGLDGMQHRKPNELSGGQQQRVSVARALVKKPAVILADEPTANLDSKTSLKILELMQNINKKHGTTFIFSTHDQQVKDHCSRVIYLKDGQI